MWRGISYYEILGVPQGAAASEIKAAYRRMSQKVPPEVAGGSRSLTLRPVFAMRPLPPSTR